MWGEVVMNILLTSSANVLRWRNFNSNGASIFPGGASVKTFNRFYHDEEAVGRFRSYLLFYNRDRLHSSLNYASRVTYEQRLV
jgi:transposase InsO family protein